ncbi:MAG: 16S rRNA (guanine(966)-N(2))-methyltransferase RsmD [Acidobacteriota bacterium]|nr:16S rRNA (guanine(966)-N(2))-methyltransferase RsmD [Blastocatellia bacterium]MDW8413538.1 16S rRNA (guanine(966)-N(2))-methyltransferase RsmD [Acidobacteriota bacterium]
MRVIAGLYKGRKLRTLPGTQIRPTSDRLREAIFNVLFGKVEGRSFLDVCAGSGAVGIEALSRGAAEVVMVEPAAIAVQVIRENLRKCQAEMKVKVLCMDALKALKLLIRKHLSYELIYFDPPYDAGLYLPVLRLIASNEILSEKGILMVEHRSRYGLLEKVGRLQCYRKLKQGSSEVSFYSYAENLAADSGTDGD